ncbi:hypothetical protein ACOME3_009345 [Neoechinorhynchus agilis]
MTEEPTEYDVEKLCEIRDYLNASVEVMSNQLVIAVDKTVTAGSNEDWSIRLKYRCIFDKTLDKYDPRVFKFSKFYLYTSSMDCPESWMPCLNDRAHVIRLKVDAPAGYKSFVSSTYLSDDDDEERVHLAVEPGRLGFVIARNYSEQIRQTGEMIYRSIVVGAGEADLDYRSKLHENSSQYTCSICSKFVRNVLNREKHILSQYTEVFVPRCGSEALGFVGLGLIDSDYMISEREVDMKVSVRLFRLVSQCFIQQYFGCLLYATERRYQWLEYGLVQYLSDSILPVNSSFLYEMQLERIHQHNKNLFTETTNILVNGLNVWINRRTFCMKAYLAVRAIASVITTRVLLNYVQEVVKNGLSSDDHRTLGLSSLFRITSQSNAPCIDDVVEHWVYTNQIIPYALKLKFNRRKNSLVVVLIQSRKVSDRDTIELDTEDLDGLMELYGDRNFFKGLVTLGVQEIDGYHFHEFYVDSRVTKFEVACTSRPRCFGNSRRVVTEHGDEKELLNYCLLNMGNNSNQANAPNRSPLNHDEESVEDDFGDDEDAGQGDRDDLVCPVLWVDVDPYVISAPRFYAFGDLNAKRNMNALRLLYGRNLIVQLEAIDSLEQDVSHYNLRDWKELSEILKIVIEDPKIYPEVCIRCAELLCKYGGFEGLGVVRKFFWKLFGQENDEKRQEYVPRKNEFTNVRLYELRKLLPTAICSSRPLSGFSDPLEAVESFTCVRSNESLCASEAIDDTLRLLKMNDNSDNCFDDTAYIICLLKAIHRSIEPLAETSCKGLRKPPFFVNLNMNKEAAADADQIRKDLIIEALNNTHEQCRSIHTSAFNLVDMDAVSTDILSDMQHAGLCDLEGFDDLQKDVLANSLIPQTIRLAAFRHFCRQLPFKPRNEGIECWQVILDSIASNGTIIDELIDCAANYRLRVVHDIHFVSERLWTLLTHSTPYDYRYYRILRLWILLFGNRDVIEGHGDGLVGGAFEYKLIEMCSDDANNEELLQSGCVKRSRTFVKLCNDDLKNPLSLSYYNEDDFEAYDDLLDTESSEEVSDGVELWEDSGSLEGYEDPIDEGDAFDVNYADSTQGGQY